MKSRPSARAQSLGDALDELIEKLGIRKKLREQDVFFLWEEAVGERIAKVTTPLRMLQGTLFVSVKTGPWRNELTMRKKEIIDRINGSLSEEIVRDIKFQ
jgi:predicted nucleic acid-binding Zn ribbon protein